MYPDLYAVKQNLFLNNRIYVRKNEIISALHYEMAKQLAMGGNLTIGPGRKSRKI